ncbi:MAG TPA: hypothetical protein VIX81_12380 [Gammaproteobacteria bacterium]
MISPDRTATECPLFQRERRFLRVALTLLATLLGLAGLALLAPRSATLATWAGDLVADLLA